MENVFEWYARQYLFGSLAPCQLLTSGRILRHEDIHTLQKLPFVFRLETFIRIIQIRREPVAANGSEILSNEQYYHIFSAWRADWPSWMNQQTQRDWYDTPERDRRSFVRRRFRTFLHQMMGSYVFACFSLYVPITLDSFKIFKYVVQRHQGVWTVPSEELINACVSEARGWMQQ